MSTFSPTKPTIVFFAGAFADPTCFDRIAPLFRSADYETVYANVPSLNPSDATTVTCANDSNATRNNVILPLIEEKHKDIVIFAHSYGGVVGAGAAAGLSKTTRAARKEAGGVIGLIYLVGNIVAEGETLLQAVGGAYPPFIKQGKVCGPSLPPPSSRIFVLVNHSHLNLVLTLHLARARSCRDRAGNANLV